MSQPNWKNTLYPHTRNFQWEQFHKRASDLGYEYFAWNGVIYRTESLTDTLREVKHLDVEISKRDEERRDIALTYVKSVAINMSAGSLPSLHTDAVSFADKLIRELYQ